MIRIFPLDFLGQGAMLTPADQDLHDMAVEFCRRELTEDVNFANLAKIWVARDASEVRGIMGYVMRPDVPLMRATTAEALRALANRYNDFLADNGARGKETTIFVSKREKPEQRCPEWNKVLVEWGAKSSERVTVTVR